MNSNFSRKLLWLSVIAVFNPAMAGPDACETAGDTRTCEGDQSDGVSVGSAPNNLIIQNLDQDITPATDTIGVHFTRNGRPGDDGGYSPVGAGGSGDTGYSGGAPTLTFDSGSMSILTDSAYGVLVRANGGRGGDGGEATGVPIPPFFFITGPSFGGNAGRGGAGG